MVLWLATYHSVAHPGFADANNYPDPLKIYIPITGACLLD